MSKRPDHTQVRFFWTGLLLSMLVLGACAEHDDAQAPEQTPVTRRQAVGTLHCPTSDCPADSDVNGPGHHSVCLSSSESVGRCVKDINTGCWNIDPSYTQACGTGEMCSSGACESDLANEVDPPDSTVSSVAPSESLYAMSVRLIPTGETPAQVGADLNNAMVVPRTAMEHAIDTRGYDAPTPATISEASSIAGLSNDPAVLGVQAQLHDQGSGHFVTVSSNVFIVIDDIMVRETGDGFVEGSDFSVVVAQNMTLRTPWYGTAPKLLMAEDRMAGSHSCCDTEFVDKKCKVNDDPCPEFPPTCSGPLGDCAPPGLESHNEALISSFVTGDGHREPFRVGSLPGPGMCTKGNGQPSVGLYIADPRATGLTSGEPMMPAIECEICTAVTCPADPVDPPSDPTPPTGCGGNEVAPECYAVQYELGFDVGLDGMGCGDQRGPGNFEKCKNPFAFGGLQQYSSSTQGLNPCGGSATPAYCTLANWLPGQAPAECTNGATDPASVLFEEARLRMAGLLSCSGALPSSADPYAGDPDYTCCGEQGKDACRCFDTGSGRSICRQCNANGDCTEYSTFDSSVSTQGPDGQDSQDVNCENTPCASGCAQANDPDCRPSDTEEPATADDTVAEPTATYEPPPTQPYTGGVAVRPCMYGAQNSDGSCSKETAKPFDPGSIEDPDDVLDDLNRRLADGVLGMIEESMEGYSGQTPAATNSNGPEMQGNGGRPQDAEADPIVLASGGMWIRSTDVEFAGVADALRFERQYSSRSNHRGILGSNWKHNYEYRIKPLRRSGSDSWTSRFLVDHVLETQAVQLEMPDGSMRVFYLDAVSSAQLNVDVFLPQAGTFGHVVFRQGTWTWRDVDGSVVLFNEYGHPTSIRDRFGRGVTIEYEPVPMYVLYRRYCAANASEFYREQLDTRVCQTLGRVFDPHTHQSVGLEGWGDPNDQFPEDMNIELPYENLETIEMVNSDLYSDVTLVDQRWEVLAELVDFRSYAQWWFDLGVFPGLPTGSVRQRPVAVVDDLGRRLEFTYHGSSVREDEGLLESITGPAGVRVEYDYDAPATQDPRVNERYLVQVSRADTGPSQTGKMTGVVAAPDRTTTYTYAWPSSGFASFDGSGAAGAFTDRVRSSYLEYYSHTTGCQLTSGGVTEVCFGSGSVCSATDQCSGGSQAGETCFLRTGKLEGNPCFMAADAEARYVSAVADNVVRVTHDGVIESETAYGVDPDGRDFDRATHQRYGGLPLSEYAQPVAARVTGAGFVSDYPDYVLEYAVSGPETGISGDMTDALLPAALIARFPLESDDVTPPDPTDTVDPVGDCAMAPEQSLIDAYDPVCDMTTFELTNRQQAYCDLNQGYIDAKEQLPGYVPQRPYYTSNSLSGDTQDLLWRSRVSCRTLATYHVSDPSHNGVISRAFDDTNGDFSHYGVEASMRTQVARDLRRICAWTKTTDRDGDVTYYGINFRGQQLVTASKKRGSTDYTVTETLYNADGKVRQERDPTLAPDNWEVGDGHTTYTYDEVEFSGQASGDHLEPWWWNRRGSLLKVEEYPGPGGALAHEWTTGSTLGAGEVIEKRVTNYEYESLFQLVRLVRSSVVVGGVTHDLRQVVHDYAYQELSLDELERRASGMISLGFPYYVIHAQKGAGASVYAETIREMFQVPTYGDQTTGLDINGDGKIGVVFDDSDPDHIGPIQGALVRTSILDMTGAQPEVERSILVHPGLAGQTMALVEPERSYMEFAFFETDGVGGGLGPDDAEATALASRYEYGLMARAMLKRYSTDLPDDIDVLDPQGNATTLTSCDHLPGSYRWMLPGGCAGDSFQQAYDRLEDELGLEAELVDRIQLMADANTDDDYRTYKFAYNELGQIYLSINDGERTSFVRDTDGRLLSRTEHYPVAAGASTAGAPIRTVTTYGRTLKGRVGYARVEGGSGQLLSESFAQYDDEGNPLAKCVQVEVGAQCATALGAGSGCGGANTVLGARACAQAIDTAPPVPLHASRDVDDPAYLLTTMRHTAEGQLAERKTPGTAHEEFEYDEFGRMTSYERSGSGGGNEQLRHTYDVRGRRTQTTIGPVSGPNLTRQYFYDGYDRLVRELDERGVNHHVAYDRLGYMSASKVGTSAYGSSNPAPSSGLESLWRYDAVGRLVAVSDGGGESRRSYSYAPGDTRPVAISQTGRGTRWMTYDGLGRQMWSVDGEGNQRVFLDDPKTHAVGQALVRKSSVPTDTYLSETTMAYAQDSDNDERRIIRFGHKGGLAHASLVRRDGLGRVVMSVRPDGTKTELTYDLTGMPITVAEESEAGTDSISKIYDAFGNVIDVYEPVVGERTSYEYDGLGRLEATYLPMAPLEPMREYDYDELGRVSRRTLRTGPGTYEFLDSSYDSSGDLTALVWDDNLGGGERTLQEYTWDDARRLTSSTHHNLKLADMGFTGTQSTITRTYDGLNRLTSETFGNLGTALPVTSTHWISGGPSLDSTIWTRTVESPSARKWHRRQDKIGRVDEITVLQKVTHVATHELDWMGGLLEGRTVDFGQTGVDDFRYIAEHDKLGRVEHLAYRAVSLIDPDTPEDAQWGQDYCANGSWHHDPCAAPLFEVDVRHDVLGQIVATRRRFAQPLRVGGTLVDLASRPWPFRGYDHSKQGFLQKEWLYDSVDETKFDNNLSSHHINQDNLNYVTGGATGQTWNWVRASKVGSLESIELDTDPNTIRFAASTRLAGHRLGDVSLDTGPNSADFTVEHDGQGRVIFDGRYRYVWNVLGELVLAYDAQTTNPSAANYVEAYFYDTSSRLSQVRTDGAGIQMFVHDGDQKLGSYILKKSAVSLWEATWGVGIDDLIGFRDDAGEYEVLTDERHSPVALWNHTGLELAAMGDYDANGRMSTQPPDMSGGGCVEVGLFGTPCLLTTNANVMPFAFNGAWKSSVTGMSQMRFRWYSPTLGQFVSHDPLGSIDSYNLYSFARFGPNTRWDPWGLEACGFVCQAGKNLDAGLDAAGRAAGGAYDRARDAARSAKESAEELYDAAKSADFDRELAERFVREFGKEASAQAGEAVDCGLSPIECAENSALAKEIQECLESSSAGAVGYNCAALLAEAVKIMATKKISAKKGKNKKKHKEKTRKNKRIKDEKKRRSDMASREERKNKWSPGDSKVIDDGRTAIERGRNSGRLTEQDARDIRAARMRLNRLVLDDDPEIRKHAQDELGELVDGVNELRNEGIIDAVGDPVVPD